MVADPGTVLLATRWRTAQAQGARLKQTNGECDVQHAGSTTTTTGATSSADARADPTSIAFVAQLVRRVVTVRVTLWPWPRVSASKVTKWPRNGHWGSGHKLPPHHFEHARGCTGNARGVMHGV